MNSSKRGAFMRPTRARAAPAVVALLGCLLIAPPPCDGAPYPVIAAGGDSACTYPTYDNFAGNFGPGNPWPFVCWGAVPYTDSLPMEHMCLGEHHACATLYEPYGAVHCWGDGSATAIAILATTPPATVRTGGRAWVCVYTVIWWQRLCLCACVGHRVRLRARASNPVRV